jgi:hypothetical protein
LIAACYDGLYTSVDNGYSFRKIADGLYSDITLFDQCFSVLHYNANELVCYQYENTNNQWTIQLHFKVDKIKEKSSMDSVAYADHYYYICSWMDGTVYKYTVQGIFIKHSNKYDKPMVCGVDTEGNLLITSYGKNTLHVINTDTMSEVHTQVNLQVPCKPLDVLIDKDLHVRILNEGSPYKLSKYTTS